jgi:type IV pilus assembly protein PilF
MLVDKTRLAILLLLFAALLMACGTPSHQLSPENARRAAIANAELGTGYLAQGNLELSKAKFEKALGQDSNLPQAHAGYALLMSRLGQNKAADKHFKLALRGDPFNSDTLNNYGTYLCGQNRIEEAEKQFLAALRDPLYRTPEYAYTNAGRCSMKVPDYDRAEGYYGKALQGNPRFTDALYEMAVLYDKKGNHRLAWSYMQKFEQHGGANVHTATSLWLAIQLARHTGDRNAEASYSLLLRNRFPDSPEASQLRSSRQSK